MNATIAPQLTVRAIVLAIVLAMMLAAANTYLGLFAGMTIASAIPAAVVSMAVLRVLGGGGDPREQHRADRRVGRLVDRLGRDLHDPGARDPRSLDRFRVPVGARDRRPRRHPRRVLLGAAAPLADRRAGTRSFPEGKAAAEVLKAGENPAQGVQACSALSALGGGLAKLAAGSGLRLIPGHGGRAPASSASGSRYFGTNLSPALLGVGYIVGLNIGVLVLVGGMISWNIAIPIYARLFPRGQPGAGQPRRGRRAPRTPPARSGRRRSATSASAPCCRRRLGADLDPQVAAVGHQAAASPRRAPARRRSSAHTEQRPADEVRS